MAIVQTLSKSSFIDAFTHSSRKDQFSYEALEAIFDYLEEYSDSTGEPVELDIVAICCDYAEDTVSDIARSYSIDLNDADPEAEDYEEQCRQIVFDYLSNETAVIGDTADGFVYAQF